MQPFGLADKTGVYPQAQMLSVSSLGAGGVVYWDLTTQQNAELTLVRNVTFMPFSGWRKGLLVMVEIVQGGAGSYTVAWHTNFKNVSAITLQTTAGYSDRLVFKCIDGGYLDLVSQNISTRS